MKKILFASFFLVSFLLACEFALAMPAQIQLIRHGEKLDDDNPDLSPQGWQRAQALSNLYANRPEFLKFGPPVALYAMTPSRPGGSMRAIQTLKFLSAKLNLPIQQQFVRDQVNDLVRDIESNKSYDGKTVLICWEHDALLDIAKRLGLADPPKWPGEQFDRVWVMNFQSNGTLSQFQSLPQRLLPTDSPR